MDFAPPRNADGALGVWSEGVAGLIWGLPCLLNIQHAIWYLTKVRTVEEVCVYTNLV